MTTDLPMPRVGPVAAHAPKPMKVVLNWGRRYSLWVFNFGLACCAIEFIAASMARHDFIRLGVIPFAPGPRKADLMVVSIIFAAAVSISWIRRRFEAGLVTMISVSEAAQRAVLPELPERVGDLACSGLYHSAQQGASIGGDFFDVRPSPYGTRMILGDVQGHGLEAVGTASMLLSVFHEAILDEVADRLRNGEIAS